MKKLLLIVLLCTSCAPLTAIPDEATAATAQVGTVLPVVTSVPFATPLITIAPLDTPTRAVTPTMAPIPSSKFSPTEIKYRLIAQFGEPFFCDPDFYPVGREVTDQELDQRFEAIRKNPELFEAIARNKNLSGMVSFTQSQKQIVYNESKKLNSILLEPSGNQYRFSLRTGTESKGSGLAIEGAVDGNGTITVTKRQTAFLTCPICLAVNTMIDTPLGSIRVQELKIGMPIWTLDSPGARSAAVVTRTISRPVPADFEIVHLVLADGRAIFVSAPHPTADGRVVGNLRVGDALNGSSVAFAEKILYRGEDTFDILPSGETGLYWANGILLRSTLDQ